MYYGTRGLSEFMGLGAETPRTTRLIDRRIAAAQRKCVRRGGAFTVSQRLPLRTSCIVPTAIPSPLPTPVPGVPPPIYLKKAQINRMLADARRECRKRGGHLVVRSLQPFDVSCEYFGAAPAAPLPLPAPVPVPVVPPPVEPYPGYYQPAPGGGYPAPGGPSGGPWIAPVDEIPGGPGFELPGAEYPGAVPSGYPAPGFPSAAPGAPGGWEQLPPSLQPDEQFTDQVPVDQVPGFPPTAYEPSIFEETIDECAMTQPYDMQDEFGGMQVLQIVCAAPPMPNPAGFGIATVPQGAVEAGDISYGESMLVGLGRWLG